MLDKKALALIKLCLTKKVVFNISKETTTSSLMASLTWYYEKSSTSNRLFLLKRLFNLRMLDKCLAASHLNEFNTIWV